MFVRVKFLQLLANNYKDYVNNNVTLDFLIINNFFTTNHTILSLIHTYIHQELILFYLFEIFHNNFY